MPSGATSARVPSARARQLSARAAAHHGDGLKPTAPQEPPTKKPPTHRRIIDVSGGKGYGTAGQLVPQPPSATNGVGKLSLYQSFLQKQEEQANNELPQRTRQEPTVPLTARADGNGAGGADASKRKSWYNEGLAAPVVPLSARSSHSQAPSAHSKDEAEPSRLDSHRGGGEVDKASLPMTPGAALKQYKNSMSLFEQGEILDYPQVYFVGHKAKKPRATASSADNNGFDDDRGDYLWNLNDHIGFRYEILGVLGKGSFGQVLKCFDWKTNQLTALKVIRNKKRFHQQALVECKLLQQLKQRDTDGTASVVHVTDHFYFRSHMCITFEMLSINLYEFIKNNKFQGMSLSLVRRIALQLANSLKFLRKQNIIHCDLKPENILLRSPNKSSIKVIDFGSSCLVHERLYTYIQSRFYRAPEVILGLPYDTAIDMWSFGCILAELFTGYPIFPGENEVRLRVRRNAHARVLACAAGRPPLLPPKAFSEAEFKRQSVRGRERITYPHACAQRASYLMHACPPRVAPFFFLTSWVSACGANRWSSSPVKWSCWACRPAQCSRQPRGARCFSTKTATRASYPTREASGGGRARAIWPRCCIRRTNFSLASSRAVWPGTRTRA